MEEKATEKQISLMKKLGIEFHPEITKYAAIAAIKRVIPPKEEPKDVTPDYVKVTQPKGSTIFVPENGREKLIIRQCCLKAAVELHTSRLDTDNVTIVLRIAEEFERWVNR